MRRWAVWCSCVVALGVLVSGSAVAVAADPVAPDLGGGTLVRLSPTRLLDTRSGTGAPAASVAGGQTVRLQVAGRGGIPASGASAVILNVTVTGATGSGYVTVYPDGTRRPGTSNVNYAKGRTVANLVIATVGSDGKVDLAVSGASAQLVVDTSGYYRSGTVAVAGAMQGRTPARLLDTRSGLGAPAAPVTGGHTLRLQVGGRGGVPAAGVAAVLLNVTATAATGSGHVTVYADGGGEPATSNLNYAMGRTVANLVAAPVGPNGRVDLKVSGASTELVADVGGYFLSGTPTMAGALRSVAPARLLDTRSGRGAPAAPVTGGHTVRLQVDGRGGVPAAGVSAVVVNVTATGATGSGYVTVYADGSSKPATSNLNYAKGPTVANLVLAPVGPDGKVDLTVSGASSELVVDVSGYVRSSSIAWGPLSSVDPAGGALTALSCTSAQFCMSVDDLGNAVRFDGTGWTTPTTVADEVTFTSVSCASSTFCAAVGSGGTVAVYDGSRWNTRQPDPGSTFVGVSCTSSTFCMAIDTFGSAISFDGQAWSSPVDVMHGNPRGSTIGVGISCASRTFCLLDNSAGWIWTYNGTWSGPVSVEQGAESGPISCPSPDFCALATNGGYMATYNGHRWSFNLNSPRFPTWEMAGGLDCRSADFCGAVNNPTGYDASIYDGQQWNPTDVYSIPPDDTVNKPSAISCPSTSFCVSVVGRYARMWS